MRSGSQLPCRNSPPRCHKVGLSTTTRHRDNKGILTNYWSPLSRDPSTVVGILVECPRGPLKDFPNQSVGSGGPAKEKDIGNESLNEPSASNTNPNKREEQGEFILSPNTFEFGGLSNSPRPEDFFKATNKILAKPCPSPKYRPISKNTSDGRRPQRHRDNSCPVVAESGGH